MLDAYVLVISPDAVRMLEDVDFSEIETKIIAVRLDTLRKAGVDCKGIQEYELKRIGYEEYYDEKKVRYPSYCGDPDDSCGMWVE